MNARFKTGDVVRRIGGTQFGNVLSVEDGHAVVDFHTNVGVIRTVHLPVETLETVPAREQKAEFEITLDPPG